jgi:hypothetical protein
MQTEYKEAIAKCNEARLRRRKGELERQRDLDFIVGLLPNIDLGEHGGIYISVDVWTTITISLPYRVEYIEAEHQLMLDAGFTLREEDNAYFNGRALMRKYSHPTLGDYGWVNVHIRWDAELEGATCRLVELGEFEQEARTIKLYERVCDEGAEEPIFEES